MPVNAASLPPESSRRRRRSGQAMVEIAFTILPMFALILAFVNVGLLMFRWFTLQNAVREGCRYAITFQTQTGLGQDASIKNIVQQYAMGIVTAGDSPQTIFVNYFSPTALTTPIPFASGGNLPGNLVQVSVQNVSWNFIGSVTGSLSTGLWGTNPIHLNVYSADILGGYPAGTDSVSR